MPHLDFRGRDRASLGDNLAPDFLDDEKRLWRGEAGTKDRGPLPPQINPDQAGGFFKQQGIAADRPAVAFTQSR